MRIVGGAWKGRALTAPKGRATRPTADRTREAVFNILAHADWAPDLHGARVIDLFAGSGAFGFEALSRGAAFCLFVETDAGARGVIRTSSEALGVLGRARIHRRDATKLGDKPAGLGDPFHLAFLDAPYDKGLSEPALARLAEGAWLAPGALCVVETGASEALAPPPPFRLIERRAYGAAAVSFCAFEGEARP